MFSEVRYLITHYWEKKQTNRRLECVKRYQDSTVTRIHEIRGFRWELE